MNTGTTLSKSSFTHPMLALLKRFSAFWQNVCAIIKALRLRPNNPTDFKAGTIMETYYDTLNYGQIISEEVNNPIVE